MLYSMKHACKEAGMSYETLKFYCNKGLIPNVKRDKNNRRVFDHHDIAWIKSLICLKNCGMSIQEMKNYLKLCLQGVSSIGLRRQMLENKRKELLERINEITSAVDYIDEKRQFYDDILTGKKEYISNLIPSHFDSKYQNDAKMMQK